MKILYPYNEILPKKSAHDSYLFHSCLSLAQKGASVTLLCGSGSKQNHELHQHYESRPHPSFSIKRRPIVRKNNFLGISSNLPFFFFSQRFIQKEKPDIVLLSVRKQGLYHLQRKVAGVHYLYEVHELLYYPGRSITNAVLEEKKMLSLADHLTVTTSALKEILTSAPYNITTPITVIPLATKVTPLPEPVPSTSLHLFYIGALYQGQGMDLLLHALAKVEGVTLSVIGGKENEQASFIALSHALGIEKRVHFLGFHPPSTLAKMVAKADGFIAPFSAEGRMPYVAHTKLDEYFAWQRPTIAPDLPIVKEHYKEALLFTPDDRGSLENAISSLKDPLFLKQRQQMCKRHQPFRWEGRAARYLEIMFALKSSAH